MQQKTSLVTETSSFERTIDDLFNIEIAALNALRKSVGSSLDVCVPLLASLKGRLIVVGVGKSGHIARKIASTMASTGTPAQFVHPTEASHGDLGMVTEEDVVLALSWSGESQELHELVAYAKRFSIPLIAMTSREESFLAREARALFLLPNVEEICPHDLAPTTSTMLQLVAGDLLAVYVLIARGFTREDFKKLHPGGRLGFMLKTVQDIMRTGKDIPLIEGNASFNEVIHAIDRFGVGCVGILDDHHQLVGVVTDGDIRRHVLSGDFLAKNAKTLMSPKPEVVFLKATVSEALARLNNSRITSLFVVNGEGEIQGFVHAHDALKNSSH